MTSPTAAAVERGQPRAGPPPAPPAALTVFGTRIDVARRYADLLADQATVRGLIGPREVPRLWERHLLNSALVADLVPTGARVVDVGSGAGLPGLAIAVRRPDLRVDLVEPLQRRVDFLVEAVQTLNLGDSVRVVRGRADNPHVRATVAPADWVVGRAVAPLPRLIEWCLPLLSPDGRLLAVKGAGVEGELEDVRRCGTAVSMRVTTVAVADADPVRVVVVRAVRPAEKGEVST